MHPELQRFIFTYARVVFFALMPVVLIAFLLTPYHLEQNSLAALGAVAGGQELVRQ